jgi:hypothetical protein
MTGGVLCVVFVLCVCVTWVGLCMSVQHLNRLVVAFVVLCFYFLFEMKHR